MAPDIVVQVDRQRLCLYADGALLRSYAVSTGLNGVG